ncbi:MFS transporter [Streptomyces sp. NPDC049954]|uniref:MFS transporter n=1 Tax=Streptomyces sp. NPDC049954 TaxID=3155779 RepID=UPI003414D838
MLRVNLVDKIGTGMWAGTSALYFTYVTGLSVAQVGLLVGLSGALGVAGSPLGGLLADRFSLIRLLAATQVPRVLGALALLTTDDFRLLLLYSAVGSLGDRSSNVLTKLYATRVAGPERVRYQALNRTGMNIGFAIGGLAAAVALGFASTAVYRALLVGDALSFLAVAALVLRCGEARSPARVVGGSPAGSGAAAPQENKAPNPWRDRTYLLYTLTETVLFVDDAVFKVGIPLWIAHATDAPHGFAPILLVLNNALVIGFQLPLARFGATPHQARAVLVPLGLAFATGAAAFALSAGVGTWAAVLALVLAATAFTFAEMLHATISWELSVALAPERALGAYLGVHGLAQSAQRSLGPLAVTAVISTGPLGWAILGAALAGTCLGQHRLVRAPLAEKRLSVPAITVSDE